MELNLFAAPMAHAEGAIGAVTQEKAGLRLVLDSDDVRKMEAEDHRFEADTVKDGKTLPLFHDEDMKVVKTCDAGDRVETGDVDRDDV